MKLKLFASAALLAATMAQAQTKPPAAPVARPPLPPPIRAEDQAAKDALRARFEKSRELVSAHPQWTVTKMERKPGYYQVSLAAGKGGPNVAMPAPQALVDKAEVKVGDILVVGPGKAAGAPQMLYKGDRPVAVVGPGPHKAP